MLGLTVVELDQNQEYLFLYNNTKEAIKYAGGTGDDFKQIISPEGDAAREIDRWFDPKAALKNIDEDSVVRMSAKGEIEDILNPIAGKFALKDYAEAFAKSQNSSKSFPQQIYNSLILYPKGLSQMSKTILAPFTHARNFISATALLQLMVFYHLVTQKMLKQRGMLYKLLVQAQEPQMNFIKSY